MLEPENFLLFQHLIRKYKQLEAKFRDQVTVQHL